MKKRIGSLDEFSKKSKDEDVHENVKIYGHETYIKVDVNVNGEKFGGWVYPTKGDEKLFVYPTKDIIKPLQTKDGKTVMVEVKDLIGMKRWPI